MEVVVGIAVFLVICVAIGVWLGIKMQERQRAADQRARARDIEKEMRQDIIDQGTRKKVADKILREAGERP